MGSWALTPTSEKCTLKRENIVPGRRQEKAGMPAQVVEEPTTKFGTIQPNSTHIGGSTADFDAFFSKLQTSEKAPAGEP